MNPPFRPEPIATNIRINWVVYEFDTREEAEQFCVYLDFFGTEHKGVTTILEQRHFVWSRD